MFKAAVPLLRVSQISLAERFYCQSLGFTKEFAHRAAEDREDPCYMGIRRDKVWLHLSSFPGDGVLGAATNIVVENVDRLRDELVARGVAIDSGPVNQTWGNREMYVKDADGNALRFLEPR